jgi:NADPH2:quinone reductase
MSSTGTYQAVQIVALEKTMEEGIKNLQLNTLPRPVLGAEEIRIRVHASALNYFDLLMLQGRYQLRPALPFTVGSECSGVIIEVGREVTQWSVGDAVIAGMTNGDSMASELVTHQRNAIRKPPQFTHAEAAGLPVGFFTTFHALVHRGKVKRGETLLVTGAGGGMGLSAVQLGVKLGCTVIAAASSDAKCAKAKEAGAHHVINYSTLSSLKDRVAEITDGKFADVIYEVVGGAIFKECIRCIAPNGRLLVIGFASGTIPNVPANMVLVKGFSLVGVRSGQEVS